jgi:16S rRNA (cytidine1402-2'-O)-methyltransferase
MPGTLFVVATPIGNLEDISLRALRVLREATLIAAEDTRRTARLLVRHGISNRLVSFHAHNIRTRLPELVSRLRQGESIALVSDAGTPGISDPGTELVQACINQEISIQPVPGPSAPLAAAVASGFPLIPLTIYGFAPYRSKDRNDWLTEVSRIHTTVTFFEAPHRIAETLTAASSILGNRPIMLGRELTKLHEEFIRGYASELSDRVRGREKGEYTVVIGPLTDKKTLPSDDEIVVEFGHKTETGGLSRRQAVAATAKHFRLSAKEVYTAIERVKSRS